MSYAVTQALQAALYDLYAKVDKKNRGPITELRVIKSYTDRPDENRAVPPVGNTWLGPAI